MNVVFESSGVSVEAGAVGMVREAGSDTADVSGVSLEADAVGVVGVARVDRVEPGDSSVCAIFAFFLRGMAGHVCDVECKTATRVEFEVSGCRGAGCFERGRRV